MLTKEETKEKKKVERQQNVLKPLFSKYLKQKNIVGFDVETYGTENKFYMGGLYDDKGFLSFYDKDDMCDFILNNDEYCGNTYIVATNLMFDFSVLFFNTKYWNKFKMVMNGGRMIACIYKTRTGGKITFVDSLNYVMMSVEQMGKIINIPKLEKPVCLGKLPKNETERIELEIYNKRDCEVTYKFMVMLQEGFHQEGAKMKLTIASTSMDLFRRKYLRFWLFKETYRHKDDTLKQFIFDSYFGGRTENFSRGVIGGNVRRTIGQGWKLYDLNSLYPSVMVGEYPNPNYSRVSNSPNRIMLEYEGVSDVTLKAPKTYYPYLPVRYNNKLIFPQNCTFRGKYTHFELRRATKELGYTLKKMHKSLYYKKNFYPFKDFITTLYNKRLKYQAEKNQLQHTMKILMNSSYGKFGTKEQTDIKFFNTKFMSDEDLEDFHTDENKNIVMRDDDNGFEWKKVESNQAYIFPIFATYTTAMSRDLLYTYLTKYNGVYCDTDSIVTNKEMPTSNKLGDMKVEYDIKKGLLIKPKMYMLERHNQEPVIKLKGVPRVTREVFGNIVQGRSVNYDKFSKLKESVRRGLTPNTIMKMEKHIDLEDTKRKWITDFNPYEYQKSSALSLNL